MRFIFVMLSIISVCYAQNSSVHVYSQIGEPFYLFVNGFQLNSEASTKVESKSLSDNIYRIQVTLANKPNVSISEKIDLSGNINTKFEIRASYSENAVLYFLEEVSNTSSLITEEEVSTVSMRVEQEELPQRETYVSSTEEKPSLGKISANQNDFFDKPATIVEDKKVQSQPRVALQNQQETKEKVVVASNHNTSDAAQSLEFTSVNEEKFENKQVIVDGNGNQFTAVKTESPKVDKINSNEKVVVLPSATESVSDGNQQSVGTCKTSMSNNDFALAKETISKQKYEDTKVQIAQQILKSNCLLSVQIKEMMELFNYDDSKLEVAKEGYKTCFDKQNFWQVNNAFSESSSISELNSIIYN